VGRIKKTSKNGGVKMKTVKFISNLKDNKNIIDDAHYGMFDASNNALYAARQLLAEAQDALAALRRAN